MQRLPKPQKLRFHTSSSPSRIGRFCASGAEKKCASIACAPCSIWRNCSAPMAIAIGRPMADHSEKRPPTQSQKPRVREMPNSAAASVLVVSATKCWLMLQASCGCGLPPCARNHSRAERALSMVSAVVKDLEAIRNSVFSGRTLRSTCPSSCPSTLETKWKCLSPSTQSSSACTTTSGPRCEPPMPILTTSVICGLARTCSARVSMASSVSCTDCSACCICGVHC